MAATAYSTALLGGARLPAVGAAAPPSVPLPRRNFTPLRLQDPPRLSLLRLKASSDDTSTSAASGDELIADLKAKKKTPILSPGENICLDPGDLHRLQKGSWYHGKIRVKSICLWNIAERSAWVQKRLESPGDTGVTSQIPNLILFG